MSHAEVRELVRLERAIRLLRLLLAGFAALQFWLYVPPPGRDLPYARAPVAAAVIGALLVLNAISAAGGTSDPDRIRRFGIVQLAGDLLLTVVIVWLFAFDPAAALWALLIVPVIEAAYRRRLRGAVWVWAASAVGYLGREIIAQAHGFATNVSSVTYRLGVLLVVALSVGWMANSLREERLRSERRAELLAAVARAGAVAELSTPQVLDSVVESLVELGYEASNIVLFFDAGDRDSIGVVPQLPAEPTAERWRPTDRIAQLVRESGEAVVAHRDAHHGGGLGELLEGGMEVAVGVPVREGPAVVGVLAARSRTSRVVSEEELEALRLLADHAARALGNARRFEAERRSAAAHEQASMLDELTGVGNRRRANELVHSLEPGDSLVLLDCDHFKSLNDSEGHAAGDALLVALADYLRDASREADGVARFGGDEFLVLLRGAGGESGAVAQRLVDRWRGTGPRTTLSAGVAVHTDGRLPTVTLAEADAALFAAKRSGGDQMCMSSTW